MAKTITLEVARYRPEQEAEPTFESFDVPLNSDWVVLDALNYVKDTLDGSLSFRWSCRMGVCGSCRAAALLPRSARPGRRGHRFHEQAEGRQALDRPRRR
jgi:hypothetical protein